MSSGLAELENCVFGRLTARWFVGYVGKGRMYHWLCSCECGNLVVASVGNLRSGGTKSCGCLGRELASERATTHGKSGTPEYIMWQMAKTRAKKKGVPFSISVDDVVIPEKCPMLGIELFQANGILQDNSPQLDRKIPSLGYVKGNIRVISCKANRAKNNLTLDEMKLMVLNW